MNRRTEQGPRNKNKQQGTVDRGGRRKGDDIADRLLDAVDGVRQLLPALQVDAASKHTANQLWRGITGGGSNYEEARAAESTADARAQGACSHQGAERSPLLAARPAALHLGATGRGRRVARRDGPAHRHPRRIGAHRERLSRAMRPSSLSLVLLPCSLFSSPFSRRHRGGMRRDEAPCSTRRAPPPRINPLKAQESPMFDLFVGGEARYELCHVQRADDLHAS